MHFKKINPKEFILRLDRGEEIVKTVEDFLKKEKIYSGYLLGLGAIDFARLAHYRVDQKEYSEEEFNQPFEIVSLFATVTREGIHPHISLSNHSMRVIGGHLKEARVAATCEIIVFKGNVSIGRKFSEEIGLNLLAI